MIGASIKSDINSALAAGLHAVSLFHKDTWVIEHAALDPVPQGRRLLELDSFAQLSSIFQCSQSKVRLQKRATELSIWCAVLCQTEGAGFRARWWTRICRSRDRA
jgi:hypothetical protein